jgi:D-alanine-D-alanine ligase
MKVAVIFGGMSSERDVSIASGAQVFKALKNRGHEVIAVDTASGVLSPEEEKDFLESTVKDIPPSIDRLSLMRTGINSLTSSGVLDDTDVCFLALHGGMGEDGRIQGFLDIAGIPYTGTSHMGSCYAMDKDVSKILLKNSGVKTPDWIMAPVTEDEVEKKLGFPVVVKPNKEGSTVGLTVVKKKEDLNEAVDYAHRFDSEVMIEAFIAGRELTVGVLEGKPLGAGEIIPQFSEIFDYKCKYQEGGAVEIFPADLTEEENKRIKSEAVKSYYALKQNDYCRVDFRMDKNGEFWCLEANTLPGMTSSSLLPQSAAVEGIEFSELCEKICMLAIKRRKIS